MYEIGKVTAVEVLDDSTVMQIVVPGSHKNASTVGLWIEDGRHITASQRKKIYATLNDISCYTGYLPEEIKEIMKYYHIGKTGCRYFSLSDCSITMAKDFINSLIWFALDNGVNLMDTLASRTDDIDKTLYMCIQLKKCAVCGKDGEIHHWDAIGMGHDRKMYNDASNRKICLCRMHHTIAHQKGREDFTKAYHLYGIVVPE